MRNYLPFLKTFLRPNTLQILTYSGRCLQNISAIKANFLHNFTDEYHANLLQLKQLNLSWKWLKGNSKALFAYCASRQNLNLICMNFAKLLCKNSTSLSPSTEKLSDKSPLQQTPNISQSHVVTHCYLPHPSTAPSCRIKNAIKSNKL